MLPLVSLSQISFTVGTAQGTDVRAVDRNGSSRIGSRLRAQNESLPRVQSFAISGAISICSASDVTLTIALTILAA